MKSRVCENQDRAVSHLGGWKAGALFMEAGTGKTKVARDMVAGTDADLCLWVGPLRTLPAVRAELGKWGGLPMAAEFVGVESLSQSGRVFLETVEQAEKAGRVFMVVDESLKIKNLGALRTRRVLELGRLAEYRLILNGTPLSKNLLDLYPQMQFLSPLILDMTPAQFKDTFCNYTTWYRRAGAHRRKIGEKITGYANVDYLYSLIGPYVYECDLQMRVSRNWHTVPWGRTPEEREAYGAIKAKYLSLEGLDEWNGNIFMAMTQELQHSYCCSPGKVAAVRELFGAGGVAESDALIFCKFVDSAETCRREFPGARVLSYQKEALGLNLQDYAVTVFWDKTFDWALKEQASRRTFRTGQLRDCRYYDLTGDAGLERVIDRNIEDKVGMLEYFKKKTKEDITKEL